MKRITLYVVFFICCISTATGLDIVVKKESSESTESHSVRYTSADPDWLNSDGQWTYRGVLMDTVPPHYTEYKESIVTKTRNGSLNSKHCCFVTTEVITMYETSESGWQWKNNKWYFDGEKTDYFPPSYVYIREKKINTADFDCRKTMNPPVFSTTESKEEEYYEIKNSHWKWNGKTKSWQNGKQRLKKEKISYSKVKTTTSTTNTLTYK
jgi:hypothetical protein